MNKNIDTMKKKKSMKHYLLLKMKIITTFHKIKLCLISQDMHSLHKTRMELQFSSSLQRYKSVETLKLTKILTQANLKTKFQKTFKQ